MNVMMVIMDMLMVSQESRRLSVNLSITEEGQIGCNEMEILVLSLYYQILFFLAHLLYQAKSLIQSCFICCASLSFIIVGISIGICAHLS